jgi:hypothetical protein
MSLESEIINIICVRKGDISEALFRISVVGSSQEWMKRKDIEIWSTSNLEGRGKEQNKACHRTTHHFTEL